MGAALKTHLLSATARALGVLVIAGCSAGGPSAPPSPTPPQPTTNPTIQVLPATYDFGKVTPGNVSAPLEVTIRNGGDGTLSVSNIARTPADPTFAVRPDGGSKPCNSTTPTLAPGDTCTFHVAFQSASTGSFATNIQISSNDRATPVFGVPVSAALEPVSLLTVRINQLQTACPANEVTAYVSVTDQGGYPVTGLLSTNFSIVQEATPRPIVSLSYVDLAYKPIAIGGGLDFSSSLTSQPIAFADMKKGFTDLFNNLKATDLGEVVKFGAVVELTQGFTSDKARLAGAVAAPFDNGGGTKLYDAALQLVDDTAANTTLRRATILATDGADNGSTRTMSEAIANAKNKGVPIFTIGLGNSINKDVLNQMATETGGIYYEANTSQNLATIYQQLSSILYEKQYILKFDQLAKGAGTLSSVVIGATNALGISGTAGAPIRSCN